MGRYNRTKTNTTYFQDIPIQKDDINLQKSKAFEICKALANYTKQRTILLEQTKESRKKIYNLSIEIMRLHEENEEMLRKG